MPLTNSEKAALLNFYNGKVSHGLSVPATSYLGLHLGATPPNRETGATYTEPTDANYVRQAVTPATFWNSATGGDPTSADSASAVTWPTSAGAYAADVTYVLEFTSLTATTFRRAFRVVSAATIGSGDTPNLAAGALVFELGDSGDTFVETV
jgi:hypothetical protein